ncbi:HNH endonuclease signature motif containing protein [Microbacterium azadirachtae]|uniref:HNH nuclease domain-containing protein n=1 Tax=Microbacterium azadirachtae TaxID=582680 RepID=A0A0F0LM05_9MICO|nr:HNH endonuclease signature motif containing protein [Microbacterium azadirachtae]KJL33300.1 hypothetical protein RS86_01960 [Microbacterium azadirachtae]
MTSTPTEILQQVDHLLQDLCALPEMDARFDGFQGAELVLALMVGGSARRRLDAVLTGLTGQVIDRDTRLASERLSASVGCHDATELLQRALRTDASTARQFARAARVTHRDVQLSSGDLSPARYPEMADALRDGVVSVPGLLAAVGPAERSGTRITVDEREAVDGLLACTARGADLPDEHGRPGPAPSTAELADYARALMLALDPDGAEPDDTAAERSRGFWIGKLRRGTHRVGGELLPEVAGQLQRLFDAVNNPAAECSPAPGAVAFSIADPDPDLIDSLPIPEDLRTRAQRDHDDLAMILQAAAASGGMPDLGGAAPTLVVSVTAADYASGQGRAFIEGTGDDVPVSVARHTACAGGIQRVLFDERGKIVSIGTTARIFTANQRRAIILRDRECVIPGCHVPATWCEIHHVQEWADGGPTHTSNGVALCWHHHRTLETSGWQIRMHHGVPEIRGPHWWDPHRAWHRPRSRGGDPHRVRRILVDALAPPR